MVKQIQWVGGCWCRQLMQRTTRRNYCLHMHSCTPPCNITDAIVLLLLSASSSSSSASRRFLLRYLIMRKRTTSDKSTQLWQMLWKRSASLASGVHCFVQRCSYCLVVFYNYQRTFRYLGVYYVS